jgi:uncharacterized membrane protein YraQ (UPF0718 family)
MTIIRPVAAILSAVCTGLLTEFLTCREENQLLQKATGADTDDHASGCCENTTTAGNLSGNRPRFFLGRLFIAVIELLDDVAGWLVIGILLAAAFTTFVPANAVAQWGSGFVPMMLILLISIPIYICATASTPVAASMLIAGISPGTVLVFLLVGPATNLASAGLVRRELGLRATAAYLAGLAITTVGLGMLVDALLEGWRFDVDSQIEATGKLVPYWVSLSAVILLGFLAIRPLRRFVLNR